MKTIISIGTLSKQNRLPDTNKLAITAYSKDLHLTSFILGSCISSMIANYAIPAIRQIKLRHIKIKFQLINLKPSQLTTKKTSLFSTLYFQGSPKKVQTDAENRRE